MWAVPGGIQRPWDWRYGTRGPGQPATPSTASSAPFGGYRGRKLTGRQIGSFARDQQLLRQGHTNLVDQRVRISLQAATLFSPVNEESLGQNVQCESLCFLRQSGLRPAAHWTLLPWRGGFVTSEDRNRRIKYGHNVPRWWIPEFNNTHSKEGKDQAIEANSQSTENATADELLRIAKSQVSQQQLFEHQRRWAEHNSSQATAARRKAEKSTSHDKSNLKQRLRQVKQNEQKRLLNRDIRIAQWILAGLFTLVGAVSAGIVGLLVGAAIGLLIISFRLKI